MDIWYHVRDFLHPTDVENILNTAPTLWQCIFKNNSWLELAKTHDRCVPVLIGPNLSTFRPHKLSNHLYISLLASDYSGDLRYCRDEFFGSLQDGWVYDDEKYEVSFPSGVTVNIYEVLTGSEEAVLPLEELFSDHENQLQTEYWFYNDTDIKILRSPDIIGLNGPTHMWRAAENGCALRLSYKEQKKQYIIRPKSGRQEVWVNKWDKSGLISSFTKEPQSYWTRKS